MNVKGDNVNKQQQPVPSDAWYFGINSIIA